MAMIIRVFIVVLVNRFYPNMVGQWGKYCQLGRILGPTLDVVARLYDSPSVGSQPRESMCRPTIVYSLSVGFLVFVELCMAVGNLTQETTWVFSLTTPVYGRCFDPARWWMYRWRSGKKSASKRQILLVSCRVVLDGLRSSDRMAIPCARSLPILSFVTRRTRCVQM
jgi:hypothetical protein